MNIPHLSVLQLSDLHVLPTPEDKLLGVATESYFHAVLNHAFAQHKTYDLLLLSGDLAQSPCEKSYTRILQKVQQYDVPTRCLAGNHDDFALMQKIFNTQKVTCEKQTIFGNWQIVMLNSQIWGSEKGRLAQSELEFLEKALSENADLFTLIAVHHNCLPTESAWLDTMTIQNSDEFLEIVARHKNVKVITTGHIHQELHKQFGDVLVLGTPSTCFQFTPNSEHFSMDRTPAGYRVLDLYEDGSVSTTVYRLDTSLQELELDAAGY
ncbi:MAG: 3',5'-cyclic-AMP phosphodiesterase [Methylococcales bacterium]|nr:3',5'-cyclic-AMP phosphodiesterase [Methylococcales bacterium]